MSSVALTLLLIREVFVKNGESISLNPRILDHSLNLLVSESCHGGWRYMVAASGKASRMIAANMHIDLVPAVGAENVV